MRRRALRRGSNWVRGFDWDFAVLGGLIGPNSSTFDWVRVPSDNPDPISEAYVGPKTLTRHLVYPFVQIQGLTAPPVRPWFVFGLITWDGDPNLTSFVELPDVTNGALDWIHWVMMPVGYTGGGGAGDAWYSTFQYGTEQGCLDFKAQRKLPPGRGLLACFGFVDAPVGSTCLFNIGYRLGLKGDVTAPGLGGG